MSTLQSHASPHTPQFQANDAEHRRLVTELHQRMQRVATGGRERARQRHLARGKLLARERVQRLCDPGAPFLELCPLAAEDLYDGDAPGAGIVTGVGLIGGRHVLVLANDATVKGGTYYPETVKKHLRAQRVALENWLPCVYLVDSGGAFLPRQDEVFPDREHFGRIFFNQAQMSADGIPQIAAVMGSCTAGGAYVPAMCDEAVIVRGQGTIFLGGPPLVKAATGEIVSAEELGGGEMHAKTSGVVDHLADDDEHALAIVRSIVATLGPTGSPAWERVATRDPLVDLDSLYGAIPPDSRTPYDPRELLARILDASSLQEFKAAYGTTVLCGFGHIYGHPVGVIANHGILFSESACKAAHFVELCDQRGVPLVFLQNISGFMVGREYEAGGIAKDGAKMVSAVSTARVPKLTVIVGGSFGAGNYGMCGRAYDPRFLWMWPNARISVMGGEQAATVLSTVRADQAAAGEVSEQELEAMRSELREQYEHQGHPYYATARLWDDGVIDPMDTRRVLGLALGVCRNAALAQRKAPVFRM
jgi:3-methylcrotonyl-CoA carboxylase beta subunit